MEPADLTARLLQEIRDEMRGVNGKLEGTNSKLDRFYNEQQQFNGEMRLFREEATARFEVIETALRDLAEQMVMLSRGIKVAIEHRGRNDDRLEDHERRISELEKQRSA